MSSSLECDVDVVDDQMTNEKYAKYDELFLSILQREGKIEPFLDSVFRFLYRRTDFFLVQETPDLPYGFPANFSKQMVQKIFQKYDSIPKDKLKKKLVETNTELFEKQQKTANAPKSQPEPESKTTIPKSKLNINDVANMDLKTKQDIFQSNPASYNGAIRNNYSWTQSIKDIDVRVNIDSQVKSGKDVKVKIEKEALSVSVKNSSNEWNFLINDKLPWKIKPDDSTWSLFPGDHIHINLEKVQERWWENLLANEEKLDLKNINPEKPMEDLDVESQTKIKQMMYDEQQKRLGLPTSEEQQKMDILQKAWNAEGSPFKGTPFDPSVLKKS